MPLNEARPLDTAALNTFVTIAESSSLTDAAGRLGVSQSAVSQSLRQLESQIGVALVIRRSTPVRLTPAGEVLRKHADGLLGDLRRLNATVREAARKGVVQCRVGLVTSCSEVFGSKLIASLKNQAEHLTLKSGLTPSLTEAFLNREIDVLISDDPMLGTSGLERFRMFRDPMVLVAAPEMVTRTSASLPALAASEPMIKYSRSTSIGVYSEVVLRRMRIQPDIRYETDDTHTLMHFVGDGHGWALTSTLCLAQTFYHQGKVRALELDNSRHGRSIYLIAREGELSAIPAQINQAMQRLFSDTVYPQLLKYAPWVSPDIFTPLDDE
ncbi:MAG: LysR family transcriptional regulator [Marinobacterium sp.]|nr:LysR family transcriptional regulator [Marinobacterium sp.]